MKEFSQILNKDLESHILELLHILDKKLTSAHPGSNSFTINEYRCRFMKLNENKLKLIINKNGKSSILPMTVSCSDQRSGWMNCVDWLTSNISKETEILDFERYLFTII